MRSSIPEFDIDSLPSEVMNGRSSYWIQVKHIYPNGRSELWGCGVYVKHEFSGGYYHYLQLRREKVLYKVYVGTAGKISKDDLLTAIRKLQTRLSRAK